MPHSGVGAWAPRPRKLSAAPEMMAPAGGAVKLTAHRRGFLRAHAPAELPLCRGVVPRRDRAAEPRRALAHHHLVVSSARPIRVEHLGLHPMLDQILARRGGLAEAARRRDVVGRHRVAEDGEDARVVHVGDGRRPLFDAFDKMRKRHRRRRGERCTRRALEHPVRGSRAKHGASRIAKPLIRHLSLGADDLQPFAARAAHPRKRRRRDEPRRERGAPGPGGSRCPNTNTFPDTKMRRRIWLFV